MKTQVVNISAHITKDLAEKLERVSSFEKRSKSYYIKESLKEFLNERSQDIEDYLDAQRIMEEARANGEELVSFEEVFKDV